MRTIFPLNDCGLSRMLQTVVSTVCAYRQQENPRVKTNVTKRFISISTRNAVARKSSEPVPVSCCKGTLQAITFGGRKNEGAEGFRALRPHKRFNFRSERTKHQIGRASC